MTTHDFEYSNWLLGMMGQTADLTKITIMNFIFVEVYTNSSKFTFVNSEDFAKVDQY